MREVLPQHRARDACCRRRRRRRRRRRSAPPRCVVSEAALERARRSAPARPRADARRQRADGRAPGDHPPGRLREELRADRGRTSTRSASTPDAHKTQIRQAVEEIFDVTVVEVRTADGASPSRSAAAAPPAARARWKKAIVQLAPGRHGSSCSRARRRRRASDGDPQDTSRPAPGAASRPTRLREELTATEPEKSLDRGQAQDRRPQRPRPHHRAPPRRRRQAPLPRRSTSSAARTACRPRSRRSSTTRTAPPTSRCSTTPTARSATSSRPQRPAVGDDGRSPAPAPTSRPATRCRCASIPTGTSSTTSSCSPASGGQLGRSAGTGDPARGEGGRLWSTLRLPSGEMRMVRAECRATVGTIAQRRAPERQDRQGRPQPPQGQAPADARHRDEPGRPPARRRRGAPHAGRPPGDPLGQADARLPHPQEGQAVGPLHRPRPPPREEEEVADGTLDQEGPVGRGAPDEARSRR